MGHRRTAQDRARDERARAEVERFKADEQAEQDRKQARLDELAAEARGRREERAKQERREAERRAQEREDARAADEERDKQAAFRSWVAQGGAPGDFEREWPAMRAETIRRRTLDAEADARAAHRASTISSF